MLHIHNKEEFKQLLEENNKVIIDFYATWCGPCKMLAPIIKELAAEINDVKIVKVDVDEATELAEMFNIMSIPTILYFKDKQVVLTELGFKPKAKILENIAKVFN